MNIKWQALIFIMLILASLGLTRIDSVSFLSFFSSSQEASGSVATDISHTSPSPFFDTDAAVAPSSISTTGKKLPVRKWDVLDASIDAEGVLIQSLDEDFPFLRYRTYKVWSIASITKLLTAVVVLEEMGGKKKITVSQKAVDTQGTAGNLVSGEVYTSEDLIKIMLLTSSNDAAIAFEESVGGRDEFVRLINKKAGEIGMSDTVLHEASGLSDLNISTANDLLKLTKYIIEKHPDIFSWTRLPSVLVEPMNTQTSKTLYNINPFVDTIGFLGGKTGTLPEARQNIVSIFSFNGYRVAIILLGSKNRVQEIPELLKWVDSAYTF